MLNIKKIKPLNSYVVLTADKYEKSQTIGGSSILDTHKMEGALKEYQTVVAVGNLVRNIKEGDVVSINPKRYAVMKHQEGSLKDGVITDNPVIRYNFPTIMLDHEEYLLLQDNDINYVILESEEEPDEDPVLIVPNNDIIV